MDKSLSILTNETSVTENGTRPSKVLSVLKYLGVAAAIVVACMLLFVFLSAPIDDVVDDVLSYAGIDSLSEAPTAYAWTSPAPGSSTGVRYQSTGLNNNSGTRQHNSSTLTPNTNSGSTSMSYAYKSTVGISSNMSGDGFNQEVGEGASQTEILYYWEINLDSIAQAAVANGQITQLTVAMTVNAGSKWIYTAGTIYGTFFICTGSTTGSSGLDSMSSTFTATKTANFSKSVGGSNLGDQKSGDLTINLTAGITKIRFGVYGYIDKAKEKGWQFDTPTIVFKKPSITKFDLSSCYGSGNLPKIRFEYGGVATAGGTIKAEAETSFGGNFVPGTTYSANYSSAVTYDGGVTLGNVTVTTNNGYYFAGWGMSGGTISNIANYTLKTLSFSAGAYLKLNDYANGTIVLTAYFYKISVSDGGGTASGDRYLFDYLQRLDGNGNLAIDEATGKASGVQQGPSATAPTVCMAYNGSGTKYTFYSGTYSSSGNNTYDFGGDAYYKGTTTSGAAYSANAKPGNAGTYGYFVGVFVSGDSNTQNCLGFYYKGFDIRSVNISSAPVEASSVSGERFVYSGSAIVPDLTYIDLDISGRPYRIHIGDAYGKFKVTGTNNNIYATANMAGTKASISVTAENGNFSGNSTVYFEIDQLSVSETTVVTEMAQEIAERYTVVYSGYEQRPPVVQVRLAQGDFTHYLYVYGTYDNEYEKYGYEAAPNDLGTRSTFTFVNASVASEIYHDNVDVSNGKAYFEIEASGNLTGTVRVYFNILALDLDNLKEQFPDNTITVVARYEQPETREFNGSSLELAPSIASLTLTGIPHYIVYGSGYATTTGEITFYFADSADAEFPSDAVYFTDWNALFGEPTGFENNTNVAYDGDGNIIAAAVIKLELSGNVRGTFETLFKITPKPIDPEFGHCTFREGTSIKETYTGSEITPSFVFRVIDNAGSMTTDLKAGVDYTYEYSDNVDVTRSALITVTGRGNYKGTNSTTFTIVALDASKATVSEIGSFTYTGNKINPSIDDIGKITISLNDASYTLGSDQYVIAEGSGSNLNAALASTKANYVMISFTGNNPSGEDAGLGGNFYASSPIPAYFTINPKNLADITLGGASWANWTNYSPDKITYTGAQIKDLSIVTGQAVYTDNTVYLVDSTASNRPNLVYGSAGTGADYTLKGWGTNIDAGAEAGEVTFAGVNNYTGELTLKFTILPRSLTDNDARINVALTTSAGSGYDAAGNGYYFTGTSIKPAVMSVTDTGLNNKILTENTDFTVSYGTNINVAGGGQVTLTGQNNYTGSLTRSFNILPVSQKVTFEDPAESAINSTVLAPESIATDPSAKIYAQYEFDGGASGKTIQLVAYTTAIYPQENPRRVTFRFADVNGGNISLNVSYAPVTLVEVNGVTLAKTVATLSCTGYYGVIRVYAEQYDSEGGEGNLGNYHSYYYTEGDADFRLFAKHTDSTGTGFTEVYDKTYGNDDFQITPNLASYRTNNSFNYRIASDDPDVVDVSLSTSGASRTARINGAGAATVTISHGGFVGSDDKNAYLAFSVTVTVNVAKRDLTISAEQTEAEYGTAIESSDFVITYTTSATGDNYKGLTYANRTDSPADIVGLSGVSVAYDVNNMSAVGEYRIEVYKNSVTPGHLYDNYNITYEECLLVVHQRAATLYVIQNNVENRLLKTYGEDNPSDYTFNILNLAYDGEFAEIQAAWKDGTYSAPTIDFDGITAASPAGSYSVTITGATAENYVFEDVVITMIIEKAPVTLTLEAVSRDYNGKRQSAGTVTVSGLSVEGCTAPIGATDTSRLSFAYGYTSGYSYEQPSNAGTYSVRVTFTADADDNYETTTTVFSSALKILPVAPVITYGGVRQLAYSVSGIDADAVRANISGIPGGSSPALQTAKSYAFRLHEVGGEYVTYEIIDGKYKLVQGVYDVRVTYEAGPNDNYCNAVIDLIAVFDGNGVLIEGLEIAAGLAEISPVNSVTRQTYNGKPIPFDLASNFKDIIYTDPNGSSETLDKADATLYFQYGDAESGSVNDIPGINAYVTEAAPTNAGTYTVWVVYDGKIASRTVVSFIGAVVIDRYDLASGGIAFADGYSAPAFTYDAKAHTVSLDSIALKGIPGGTAPAGYIGIKYRADNVDYDAPVNAGRYNVLVSYTPAQDDNYKCSYEWLDIGPGVIVNRATVTIDYTRTDTYSFTGQQRSITAECLGVVLDSGMREVPAGTLGYKYMTGGAYITGNPVNAGVYDVTVNYQPAASDNYESASVTFYGVITISAVTPNIVIQQTGFDFGAAITPESLYTIKGAQFDSAGPVLEYNGVKTISIQYGVRNISATGSAYYSWSSEVPHDPGSYSVKVTFTPAAIDVNYLPVSATRYDCMIIANALPELELETREGVYNGKPFPANSAVVKDSYGNVYTKYPGSDDGGNYYRGNVNYEYRLAGSSVWTAIAPAAAGRYDVRVTYVPNSAQDVFSAATEIFSAALVINELTITVIPVFGQGKDYDGTTVDGGNIAFCYSYESVGEDGNVYVYYVYSTVTDDGAVIDVSKFTYTDEDGNVFVVENGSGQVWRDYYETAIRLIGGVFSDGSSEIAIDLSDFAATSGKFEYTDPASGVKYIVDLDSDIAYPAVDPRSYAYDIETGYFISSVDDEGRVTVINIPENSIVYTDIENGLGTYTRNEAGRNIVYKLDMKAMTATNSGITYKIYESAGKFAANVGGKTEIVRIDFNNMYSVDASANTALYKSSFGEIYIVDFASGTATAVYELTFTSIEVGVRDASGALVYTEVSVDSLVSAGFADAYIGKCTLGGKTVTVYLKDRVARVQIFYDVEEGVNGTYIINGITVGKQEMALTEREGVYLFDSVLDMRLYYVDLNTMTARDAGEAYSIDFATGVISGTLNGEAYSVKADARDAEYVVYRNGLATGVTALYGENVDSNAPALISGNDWLGMLRLLAKDAGIYEIAAGSIDAGSNYRVLFSDSIVNYEIGKVKLTVEFLPDEDNVFSGDNKGVDYVLEGILEGDDVRASLTYTGDNYNVTEEGYYVTLTVNSVNYYIENAVSDTYYILPAEMSAPVYDEALTSVVYDGGRHSVPVTAAADATVYYNGSLSVPYYVEPGTYLITVRAEKRNYVTVTVEIRLTISKRVYTVVPNQVPGTLKYGDPLPALTSNSTLGSIALDPGQTLMPGDNTYTWTFTPYEADFYRYYEAEDGSGNITGTIVLHVEKAKAEIIVNGNLTQSETNPVAITGSVNGVLDLAGGQGVTVEYIDSDGNRYSSMPTEAGRYTMLVTYEGDELYDRTVEYFTLTIEKETDLTWLYYVVGALVLLGGLSTVFFLMRRGKKYD